MVAGTTLTSRMQWSSTQVQSSECPLPKMLSVNSGEAVSRASILNQAAELLFLPTLRIGGEPKGSAEAKWPYTIVQSSYATFAERSWLEGLVPPMPPPPEVPLACEECVEYNETLDLTFELEWDYKFFLELNLSMPGVDRLSADKCHYCSDTP